MVELAYVVVEGHGEVGSVLNLVTRLETELGLTHMTWAPPIRGRSLNQRGGVERACEQVRRKGNGACVLLLRDEDDGCPKELGPETAAWVRERDLPFPAAVVLAHREYESLFLASMSSIAGKTIPTPDGRTRAGWPDAAHFLGDPGAKRGAKEWLSSQLPAGRIYKPTVDQLALTKLVDFALVRASGLKWFGTLERAIAFLHRNMGKPGSVYPL